MATTPFAVPDFGLELAYPDRWERAVERDQTYLFWDEDSGSLRITPVRIARDDFDAGAFLEREHARLGDQGATWRTLGARRYLCYRLDGEHDGAVIRNHFYLTGEGRVIVTCSWAYEPAAFDSEEAEAELEAATEEAEAVLASLRLP